MPDLVRNTIADRLIDEDKIDWEEDYIEDLQLVKLEMEESKKHLFELYAKYTSPS